MKVSEENTATIVQNLRAEEGEHSSRAEYVELMQKRIAELEAERDRLMLEFCPDEMSQDQIDNWANHQRPSPINRDVERYLWLKEQGHLDSWMSAGFTHLPKSEAIDADIDIAIAESSTKEDKRIESRAN